MEPLTRSTHETRRMANEGDRGTGGFPPCVKNLKEIQRVLPTKADQNQTLYSSCPATGGTTHRALPVPIQPSVVHDLLSYLTFVPSLHGSHVVAFFMELICVSHVSRTSSLAWKLAVRLPRKLTRHPSLVPLPWK